MGVVQRADLSKSSDASAVYTLLERWNDVNMRGSTEWSERMANPCINLIGSVLLKLALQEKHVVLCLNIIFCASFDIITGLVKNSFFQEKTREKEKCSLMQSQHLLQAIQRFEQ